jgi:16S rRNA (guanine527-N7)-methyltransferase
VREVVRATAELALTSIADPEDFLERHIGEAFEGAASLKPDVAGTLVDLGTGNGYPAIPLALCRPALRLMMVEASVRRAVFLRHLVSVLELERADVLEAQVQRQADLADVGAVRVLTSRAVGGWPKILPRLAPCLGSDGELLVWCGRDMETVRQREVWRKRLRLKGQRALPGRDQSWIWVFAAMPGR